jgi:mRNA interferase RelE/StbE
MKDIARLPQEYAHSISQHIDQLAENARPPGSKKLTNREEYRLRVGTYRILYVIDDESETVTVHRVKHRREAYR